MRKVLLIIIASLFSLATVAQAEIRVGVSGAAGFYDASAKETHGSKQSRSEDLAALFGSVFAEYVHEFGGAHVGLGVDFIPYEIEGETVQNKRWPSNKLNEARVDIVNHITGYVLLSPSDAPVFVKLGYSYADLQTTETISNLTSAAAGTVKSQYGDDELVGVHVSVGYDHGFAEGFFIRAEAGLHEYEDVTINSSSGGNSITAELSGYDLGLKIGKSF